MSEERSESFPLRVKNTPAETSRVAAVTIVESDQKNLIDTDSDDSDYNQPVRPIRDSESIWWFQQPAVKKNCCIVLGSWFLLCLSILCFIAGLIFEIVHFNSDDTIRGFLFFLIGIVLLIPSAYAVTHIYLAAKKVGRVRFSSVWFFR